MEFSTERYSFSVKELQEGGPGGYESTYLTNEGFPVQDDLYSIFKNFEGDFLAAQSAVLRHRNGEALTEVLENGDRAGIASGFKPSGAYHFGHKLTSGTVALLQRNNVQVFVPVADIEAEMDSKLTEEEYRFWAADNLLDWGANGVDLDAAHVYLQSEEHRVNALSYVAARSLLFNTAVDIYGAEKMVETFPFLFAGMTQVGDILLPQHTDFGNDHSFMVSGQDQDGHMKMTIKLTQATLDSGVSCFGVSSVPSGLYIPHMRGIAGDKASSSKAETTIYLGQGPGCEDVDDRIRSSLKKLDGADPENIARFSLDMIRYTPEFSTLSEIDFEELAAETNYSELVERLESATSTDEQSAALADLDDYVIKHCKDCGQDNEELVRDSLPEVLTDHHKKRRSILSYAVSLAGNGDNVSGNDANKPNFWTASDRATVEDPNKLPTRWYDIIADKAAELIP